MGDLFYVNFDEGRVVARDDWLREETRRLGGPVEDLRYELELGWPNLCELLATQLQALPIERLNRELCRAFTEYLIEILCFYKITDCGEGRLHELRELLMKDRYWPETLSDAYLGTHQRVFKVSASLNGVRSDVLTRELHRWPELVVGSLEFHYLMNCLLLTWCACVPHHRGQELRALRSAWLEAQAGGGDGSQEDAPSIQ